jgi:hypothetical protein
MGLAGWALQRRMRFALTGASSLGGLSDMRRQADQAEGKAWHGLRAGVLIAAATSLLTLAVFAAVAKVVSQDHGWLSSEPPVARVSAAHDVAGENPLRSAVRLQDLESDVPQTRIASVHEAVMHSPWSKIAHGIADTILPGYRQGRALGTGAARTKLVEFASAPFPHDGAASETRRMSYAAEDAHASADARPRGSARGRLFRQKNAYSDPRVLLHIPKSFDPNRPAVMVVFFHGHRATLTRDVLNRQQVAAQISGSGVNAVLVAPQFAVAAADSSPGKLGEPGGFKRFLDEASRQLARLHGNAASTRAFANMPVVLVAYSGGFLAAAQSLHHGGAKERVRGVVLLDALYGELDKFAGWITANRSAVFVSSYIGGGAMKRRHADLMQMLRDRDIAFATAMPRRGQRDNVFFLATGSEIKHADFVTQAWAANPISDVLQKHAGRLMGSGPIARNSGTVSAR